MSRPLFRGCLGPSTRGRPRGGKAPIAGPDRRWGGESGGMFGSCAERIGYPVGAVRHFEDGRTFQREGALEGHPAGRHQARWHRPGNRAQTGKRPAQRGAIRRGTTRPKIALPRPQKKVPAAPLFTLVLRMIFAVLDAFPASARASVNPSHEVTPTYFCIRCSFGRARGTRLLVADPCAGRFDAGPGVGCALCAAGELLPCRRLICGIAAYARRPVARARIAGLGSRSISIVGPTLSGGDAGGAPRLGRRGCPTRDRATARL